MKRRVVQKKRGFSLLEVVIVVAILAILAAIGIPRMSRGSRGAGDSALRSNLALLRNAIDLYSAEHTGSFPEADKFADQLTQFTDASGTTSATRTTSCVYGPYLRNIPPLTVGASKGKTSVAAAGSTDPNDGWVYTESSGVITSNTSGTENDDAGILYTAY